MSVALSLRQPWAWLVVHAGKLIENRRWDTKRRGQFLVHAAKGMTRQDYADAVAFAHEVDPGIVIPARTELLFGGIVGHARIVDVIPPCSPYLLGGERCSHPWHMPAQFGFVLADIAALDFVPLDGMLGFFDFADARAKTVFKARMAGTSEAELGVRYSLHIEKIRQLFVMGQAKEQRRREEASQASEGRSAKR